jgi:MoaA/NifB/PqqE/SkfB family radical SAM enzyme
MCDIWKQNLSADGELTTKDWENVLSGLRQWLGGKHIWFTGGEPFLRKDCIDLIRYGSSIGLSIAVITNGILLRPDQMRPLIEAGLKEYHVSIDSMDSQTHDNLRGIKGAHKRATKNVLALKDAINRSSKKMKIVIKTIIMGYNRNDILPLVEWVEKNGFDEIKFQPIESNLEGMDDHQWFNSSPYWPKGEEVNELIKIMDELIRKKQAGSNIYNSIEEMNNTKEYFMNPVASYEKAKNHTLPNNNQTQQCKSATDWMEILSHGGLRMCRYMSPQGDIRSTTPKKFWLNRTKCWRDPSSLCFKRISQINSTEK